MSQDKSSHLQNCQIISNSDEVRIGRAFIFEQPKQARVKNAALRFLVFFLLATFSVLLPLLHFFFVPAFLITAVYVSAKALSETLRIEHIEGECPSCHKAIRYGSLRVRPTLKEICPECRQMLSIKF